VIIDKKKVDDLIPKAYDALKDKDIAIAVEGKIKKAYRGQIAAFGAAMSMGSVISAVAFFNNDGSSECQRSQLMRAIERVLEIKKDQPPFYASKPEAKSEILHAAIAIKLAMNLYEWVQKEGA